MTLYLFERLVLAWLYIETFAVYADPIEAVEYALLATYHCGMKYDIDPVIAAVIIHHESHGDEGILNKVTSDTGLMQLKPKYQPFTVEELKDPWTNIKQGCQSLYDWKVTWGKGEDYLAHYAGGSWPQKQHFSFAKWFQKRVAKAEKIWAQVPAFFDDLNQVISGAERVWDKLTKRIHKVEGKVS